MQHCLGYGACAINPYLAHEYDPAADRQADCWIKIIMQQWMITIRQSFSGIVKIASKMGISTIQSYQGSKIFEAIGIDKEVIDKYFTNTVSRVGGITLEDIAEDIRTFCIPQPLIRWD